MTSIHDNLTAVRARIQRACAACGREPEEIGLIAVSKKHPAAAILQAHGQGQLDFGENYAQELRDKGAELSALRPPVRWHYVGQIQSNKAKYIAPLAYRVHALESARHARALAKRATDTVHALVAVNVGGERSKGGVEPSEALRVCAEIHEVEGVRVVGLMTLPPPVDDPNDSAPYFEQLADLAARGRAAGMPLEELSMGMSHDFEVAIRYGATWIRVGTAIFGPREA